MARQLAAGWSVDCWPVSGSWSVCWPDRWHLVSWWARQVVVGCSIYCLPVILFTGPFAVGRSVWPLVSHFAFGHAIEWSFGWSGQLFALSSWRPEFELILWKDQHKVVKMSKDMWLFVWVTVCFSVNCFLLSNPCAAFEISTRNFYISLVGLSCLDFACMQTYWNINLREWVWICIWIAFNPFLQTCWG